jgi:hypothetical protein
VAPLSLKDPGRLTYGRFLKLLTQVAGPLSPLIGPSKGLHLHRTGQHRKSQVSMPWKGFEPMIPRSKRSNSTPQTARQLWSAEKLPSFRIFPHKSQEQHKEITFLIESSIGNLKCKPLAKQPTQISLSYRPHTVGRRTTPAVTNELGCYGRKERTLKNKAPSWCQIRRSQKFTRSWKQM